jgi:hypothetical protein
MPKGVTALQREKALKGENPKGGSGMKQARERTRNREGAERVRNPGRGRR